MVIVLIGNLKRILRHIKHYTYKKLAGYDHGEILFHGGCASKSINGRGMWKSNN